MGRLGLSRNNEEEELEEQKDRYTTDRTALPLQLYTRLYPPRPATIAGNSDLILLDKQAVGEGFFDFLYATVSKSNVTFVVERDSIEWIRLSPYDVHHPLSLALTGWNGLLGCQIWQPAPPADEEAYGITIVPLKDTVPYYTALRIWVENPNDETVTMRKAIYGWRIRQRITV